MFGKLFRLMIYCAAALSLVAFALVLMARPYSNRLVVSQPSHVYWLNEYGQTIPNASGPVILSPSTFDRSWQFMTSPVLKGTQTNSWTLAPGGSTIYPEMSPLRRTYSAIVDVMTTPIVAMALILAAIVLMLRRGRRRELPPPVPPVQPRTATQEHEPEVERKRRQQAEVIRRMYGVMDRIETRVERLESSLLP